MHETHGRLATLMFVQVTETEANKKEIPVAQHRLDVLQKSLSIYAKHFHGDLVEISSGEIFAYFPGAVLAFNAAVGLPRLMPQFSLRIGLHVGEVLVRQEKLQGTDVNLAARLPYCSRAGGICLSQTVYQYLRDDEKQKLIAIGAHKLKNFDIKIPLYAYLPDGQQGRCNLQELQHHFVVILQKNFKYFLLLFLAGLIGLYSWSKFPSSADSGDKLVTLETPVFAKYGEDEQARELLDSIEMTVSSQLAGTHDTYQLKLVRDRSSASAVLLVKLSAESEKLKAEYTLKGLTEDATLLSGRMEGETADVFQFQDALSRKILLDLKKY
ncbi:MAG: adenylate/guanylate cyclase domain-containing protein [Pseudomonadota bacterium]|nr:adenylate/guanylate cyclase domain-containing protein [Pseudomonadota bacterium]